MSDLQLLQKNRSSLGFGYRHNLRDFAFVLLIMSSRNESQRAARPRVAIIYSEGAKDSAESVNLATYLSCCFASSGYASIFLVPCASDGTLVGTLPETKRMHFVPPTKTNVVEVPVST